MKKTIAVFSILTASLLIASGTTASQKTEINDEELIKLAKDSGLKPIPRSISDQLKLINKKGSKINRYTLSLGKSLYFDPRLSKSGLISCNTCHNLSLGGVDGVSVSIGDKWTKNPHELNSPTVYNAVFNKKQFWDGRSPDLEDQAQDPIQAAPEMAATPEHVKNIVNSIPKYKKAFQQIKKDPNYEPTIKDVADVIAKFERVLITRSKYDEYLLGNKKSLTLKEKKGLKKFIQIGCTSCHNGYGLGGDMAPFPAVKPYKYASGDFKGDENGMVKTPILRNITKTAPYFHNGKVWNLKEAIEIMGETQLGHKLSKEDVEDIYAFLKSLNGKPLSISIPFLPESTEKTEIPQN